MKKMTILLLCLMLALPVSAADGRPVPFLDALFTATTATCVTGLVTLPTVSTWSVFGQGVILILIQVGGLGVITIMSALMILLSMQLLWINLVTDSLPAIALGLEPHTESVMQEKPRPRSEGILTKEFLTSVGLEGVVIAIATIIAFHLGLNNGGAAVDIESAGSSAYAGGNSALVYCF